MKQLFQWFLLSMTLTMLVQAWDEQSRHASQLSLSLLSSASDSLVSPFIGQKSTPMSNPIGVRSMRTGKSELIHSSLGHQRRADRLVTTTSAMTNASFETEVCAGLASYSTLTITSGAPTYFQLPSCVAGATSLATVNATRIVLTSFALLPSSLTELILESCLYSPDLTIPAANDGFDEEGKVAWTEIWSALPLVTEFSIVDNNLRGGLPDWIPSSFVKFLLQTSPSLSGALPSTLFSKYTSLTTLPDLDLTIYNARGIVGTLPYDIFEPFNGKQICDGCSFEFGIMELGLTGPIPAGIFAGLTSLQAKTFAGSFAGNSLNGTIPDNFFPFGVLRQETSSAFYLSMDNNQLSGSMPSSMFAGVTTIGTFQAILNGNKFTELPAQFFESAVTWKDKSYFRVDLSNNELEGTIPPALFTSSMSGSTQFRDWILVLSHNSLTGSLPEMLASPTATAYVSNILWLEVSYNDLSGTLPPNLFLWSLQSSLSMTTFNFFGQANLFTGTIPSGFIADMPSSASLTVQFNVAGNNLTGQLPELCDPVTTSYLTLYYNNFTGTIPDVWATCNMPSVDIHDNPLLSGSLPPNLFAGGALKIFSASDTNLTGDLPPVTGALTTLLLANTGLELCSNASNTSIPASFTGTCVLDGTAACSCGSDFEQCSVACSPAACIAHPPSAEFSCIGGVWTASSVTTPTLIIPTGSVTVVVRGNMSSSSVIFDGTTGKIDVRGCAQSIGSVAVALTVDDLKQLSTSEEYPLMHLRDPSCSANLSLVTLKVNNPNGCDKATAARSVSGDGTSLSAIFTVQHDVCSRSKTWWIIVVSVVCGVIVLIVLVIILLAVFYKPFRLKIRPFSKKRATTYQ